MRRVTLAPTTSWAWVMCRAGTGRPHTPEHQLGADAGAVEQQLLAADFDLWRRTGRTNGDGFFGVGAEREKQGAADQEPAGQERAEAKVMVGARGGSAIRRLPGADGQHAPGHGGDPCRVRAGLFKPFSLMWVCRARFEEAVADCALFRLLQTGRTLVSPNIKSSCRDRRWGIPARACGTGLRCYTLAMFISRKYNKGPHDRGAWPLASLGAALSICGARSGFLPGDGQPFPGWADHGSLTGRLPPFIRFKTLSWLSMTRVPNPVRQAHLSLHAPTAEPARGPAARGGNPQPRIGGAGAHMVRDAGPGSSA